MDDKELYRQILGVVKPWEIKKIDLDMSKQEVHIFLEYPLPSEGVCPKCGAKCSIHDKREERIWRHLDTCSFVPSFIARLTYYLLRAQNDYNERSLVIKYEPIYQLF